MASVDTSVTFQLGEGYYLARPIRTPATRVRNE